MEELAAISLALQNEYCIKDTPSNSFVELI